MKYFKIQLLKLSARDLKCQVQGYPGSLPCSEEDYGRSDQEVASLLRGEEEGCGRSDQEGAVSRM